MTVFIPYDNLDAAIQRSAEFWTHIRGNGWQEGNVTQYRFSRWQRPAEPAEDEELPEEGVDFAIKVNENDPELSELDSIIADQVMTALEAVPCAEFYPAWEVGQVLVVGDIRTYTNGNLYVTRQAHTTQADWTPDVVTPTLFMVYRKDADTLLDWIAGEKVELGWQRTFGGDTYQCLQGHVTQSDWTPDVVPNLWELVVEPSDEWQPGILYYRDDVVTYNDVEYICLQQHTSIVGWEPPNVPALWHVV